MYIAWGRVFGLPMLIFTVYSLIKTIQEHTYIIIFNITKVVTLFAIQVKCRRISSLLFILGLAFFWRCLSSAIMRSYSPTAQNSAISAVLVIHSINLFSPAYSINYSFCHISYYITSQLK